MKTYLIRSQLWVGQFWVVISCFSGSILGYQNYGADVNAVDKTNGVTPLWIASQNGHAEIVKLLLAAKADVNTASKTDGVTPLLIASLQGYAEVVKLLLKAGADVNILGNLNGIDCTPLSEAKKKSHTRIIKLLKKYGAKD